MKRLLAHLLAETALRAPEGEGSGAAEGEGGGDEATAAAAAAKPQPPEGLDPKYWDPEAGALKAEDLVRDFTETSKWKTENEARLAAIAEREAAVPADESGYEIAFPADAPVEDDFTFEIDPSDPMLAAARSYAKKNGLSQEAFTELLGIRREMERLEFRQMREASAQFRKELGTQVDQREDAMQTYLKSVVGEDAAMQLSAVLFNKTQFEAMERLVSLAQGVKQNGYQGGGTGGQQQTLSDEEWDAMSPDERIAYGRKHTPPAKPRKAAA